MSAKSTRKPLKQVIADSSIDQLKEEIGHLFNAFKLIADASHPGRTAGTILSTLSWLNKRHDEVEARLKKAAPELFEQKPVEPETKPEGMTVVPPTQPEATA